MNPSLLSWKLCDELTVLQAMYLLYGDEPCDPDWLDRQSFDCFSDTPVEGWVATITAIKGALKSKAIEGEIILYNGTVNDAFPADFIDPARSTLRVASFKQWLQHKGIASEFFDITEETAQLPFLDPDHPRYSAKLAATINALKSINDDDLRGTTPKKVLMKHLRANAARDGLLNPDGSINNTGIAQCAAVANWEPKGGSPRTPSSATQSRQ